MQETQRKHRKTQETQKQVQSLGQEDPLEEKMATHSSTATYSPWDRKELDMTERLHIAHKWTSAFPPIMNDGLKSGSISFSTCDFVIKR